MVTAMSEQVKRIPSSVLTGLIDVAHERRHSLACQWFPDNDEGDALYRIRDQRLNRIDRLLKRAETETAVSDCDAQVNRIPAGLYAELEALRTLRDATGVYLQGYMRDEIEDEDNCVTVDQHDAACSVKSALDNARALEWKGCGDA